MEINRRHVLRGLFSATLAGLAAQRPAHATAITEDDLYAAATREADGTFAARIMDRFGRAVLRVALPARGHDTVAHPHNGTCVIFARRPGTFAVVLDPSGRRAPLWLTSRVDRHFYGHGAFSANGHLLYTTENDFGGARGVIGVRDATDGYRWIGEFPSAGVGPHDLTLMPDDRTLVIANGGIETHPATGRRKLNLADMASNLTRIDTRHGDVRQARDVRDVAQKLSLRHLAPTPQGTVVFAAQYQGPRSSMPSLVGILQADGNVTMIDMPKRLIQRMRGYVTSVACDREGRHAVVTSARGNCCAIVDIAGRKVVTVYELPDASGIAVGRENAGFVATSGTGHVVHVDRRADRLATRSQNEHNVLYDNHLARI